MPSEPVKLPPVKRRYSVTGDILSYRRCKRQYGFFVRRGYMASQSGQLFFGTVIHETLDRVHAHYRGEVEGISGGAVPEEAEVERYFLAAERALLARGVRPLSRDSRNMALEYVQRFNRAHGESVYPRIVDTEHRLQKDKGSYLLYGVVDVIAQGSNQSRSGSVEWENHEIWDYKGSKRPQAGPEMMNYEFQMRVYSHLYSLRNGVQPAKAVLWFLGEGISGQTLEVSLDPAAVSDAVTIFEETVTAIEESIRKDGWSRIRRDEAPSVETCDACDLRWSCPAPAKTYRIRPL